MNDTEARFELLLHELRSIQDGIRALDKQSQTIKGWCVTVVMGLATASVTTFSKGVPIIGAAAVLAFWLVDAHFKSIQRIYLDYDFDVQYALRTSRPTRVINSSRLPIPALASRFKYPAGVDSWARGLRFEMRSASREALEPLIFTLYLFMLVFLGLVVVVLHMAGAPWIALPTK